MYAVFTPRYTPIENLKYPEIEKATTKLINNLNDYKYNKIIFYKYIDGIFFVEALVQKKEENPIKVIIIYNKRLEVKEFFIETSYDINDINISDIK
jgi:predicted RNA-binding protein with PIN domain